MLVEAANRLNVQVSILDQGDSGPAKQLAAHDQHIQGNFQDAEKIRELAQRVDILTVEIEHVNVAELIRLKQENPKLQIHPSPRAIKIIQDKFEQKRHLNAHGVPLPAFQEVKNEDELKEAGKQFGYPLMLKAKRLAYDGRGNAAVHSEADIPQAWRSLQPEGSQQALYVEQWVPFAKEIAVMVARGRDGSVRSYPVVETVQRNNICHLVLAPAQIDGTVAARAKKIAETAIISLEGAGIYGVEMFVLEDGGLLLNEIAPRPHNSGHYTIEACETSQFENHLRAIMGRPLGSPALKVGAAAMVNILGDADDVETMKPCVAALSVDGATIHAYGKGDCRPGRKMGHITVVGQSMTQVHNRLRSILKAASPTEAGGDSERIDQALGSVAPLVGVIMGSDSDLPTMKAGAQILEDFGVPFELTIVSAHRTPERLCTYARTAHKRGIKVIIAAAGGAAHLPGMVASMTPLPVIGVPIKGSSLDGVDSLYSIVQMPRGVPVATVAINNSTNGALLAVRMLAPFISEYLDKMAKYQHQMEKDVLKKADRLETAGWADY
ncbi:AIR carboxylase-domain-containing protein [Dimargaris cristalligena]|uniref:Phosphoribosylaminoimidazole carboxylase n=1 Tax=Dimargaris cristalligena TaxID=215637 RepID=A0A4V1J5G1_9FUNG|nr:AIR carboxylase-domain-containing protein [Dimargaris cristalligena]|eukprot:RKP38939.1 AIR carboxylase-domain-containing protein [Dimargaris cristalligena]